MKRFGLKIVIVTIGLFLYTIVLMPMACNIESEPKLLGSLKEDNIFMYALDTKQNKDSYYDLLIMVNGRRYKASWYVNNERTSQVRIFKTDINNDNKDEVVIINTSDLGENYIIEDVHIFD